MKDLRWRGPGKVWESVLRGTEKSFTTGRSPGIWGNFPKICIKLWEFEKLTRKFQKNENFSQIIFIFGHDDGKIISIIQREAIMGVRRRSTKSYKVFKSFPKLLHFWPKIFVKKNYTWKGGFGEQIPRKWRFFQKSFY